MQCILIHHSLWMQPPKLFPRLLMLHLAHLHHVVVYALPAERAALAGSPAAAWFARQAEADAARAFASSSSS